MQKFIQLDALVDQVNFPPFFSFQMGIEFTFYSFLYEILDECVNAMAFLAADSAGFITGINLPIDGGKCDLITTTHNALAKLMSIVYCIHCTVFSLCLGLNVKSPQG